MKIELFDYDLPPELIAQYPSRKRDQSRLLVLNRATGKTEITHFNAVVDFLQPGDGLVVNRTKVFKARLNGRRATGARVELFLVRPDATGDPLEWLALVSPSRRVKPGESVLFDEDRVELIEYYGDGRWRVRFRSDSSRRRIISRCGHVPLPHYIRRDDLPTDIRRYQTVFADAERVGAVAAPTAGFHFTRPLLKKLETKRIERIEICLHVGPGTFKPVSVDRIEDHTVDPEMAELDISAAKAINKVRERGGKIWAVGTTSVRTLESAPIKNGKIQPFEGMVDLYIRPGHEFRVVDHLITNFHLPKSSLIILVAAFAGRERVLEAYREAVAAQMRFYSYGDAMLIL
ncbi:MAG TPA: tRNA preQ1(34) S-adenosylmethionine ribosyltransferase-isomerase QueA [candidate division Zixibacteria bacterium]|mgnify:CR=1 FL=1|nr:tRNA preQ1(34) S-adenosylmethionine ribosyltransferase-isomerase QueA [candidate division Zixibacteria bacterium]